jgi:hypothetical protein
LAADTDHFPATIGPIEIPARSTRENEMPQALHRLDRDKKALSGGIASARNGRKSMSPQATTGVIESSGYHLASALIGPCVGRKTP